MTLNKLFKFAGKYKIICLKHYICRIIRLQTLYWLQLISWPFCLRFAHHHSSSFPSSFAYQFCSFLLYIFTHTLDFFFSTTFRSAIVIPLPQLLVPVKVLKIALKSGSECQNPGKTLSNSNVVVSLFVLCCFPLVLVWSWCFKCKWAFK